MSTESSSRLVYLDFEDLQIIRSRLREGDPECTSAYGALLLEAEQVLSKPLTSVMDKTEVAASGDKRDFYAIGAYSWPDPQSADGMPYIRRDGLSNPEAYASDKYDKGRMQELVDDMRVLALAYHYSAEERFSIRAIERLRSWFITPETRMKPRLRYAAAQPGVNDGRHSGIIEGVILIELLDYVEIISVSESWSESDGSSLRRWFLDFSDWLVKSDFGRKELASTNNHGAYYLAQVAAFASYGGNEARARDALLLAKRQLNEQFDSDGSMPREIDRPNAFFYSIYGLRAFIVLAVLGDRHGQDLWGCRIRGQKTPAIANSLHYLYPYLSGKREWTGPRLDTGINPYAVQMCRMAATAYPERAIDEMISYLSARSDARTVYDSLVGLPRLRTQPPEDVLFARIADAGLKPMGIGGWRKASRFVQKVGSKFGLLPAARIR